MTPEERDHQIEAMKATFPTRDEINARFDQVPTRDEMHEAIDAVNRRFDQVPTRDEMHEAIDEMGRRFGVLTEDIRSMVQGLAEGIESLGERMDARFAEQAARQAEDFDPLRAGYR